MKMLANITSSACLCAQLSRLQEEDLAEDHHSALAKAFCTVRMRETVGYARELLGGNGILLENQVGRFVADSEAIYSYEGTREINTLIVAAPSPASAPSCNQRRDGYHGPAAPLPRGSRGTGLPWYGRASWYPCATWCIARRG